MKDRPVTYDELLKKVKDLDPFIVAAINDVDDTLLEEFKQLSFDERIQQASEGAAFIAEFTKQ